MLRVQKNQAPGFTLSTIKNSQGPSPHSLILDCNITSFVRHCIHSLELVDATEHPLVS